MAKKIETSLKDRLRKLGIDKNKPIEIKVITTSIPPGGEDLEGIAGSQYDGIGPHPCTETSRATRT